MKEVSELTICIFTPNNHELARTNQKSIFYCGQRITGLVNIELDEPITMSALVIRLSGKVRCHWTESIDNDVITATKNFTDKATILKNETALCGDVKIPDGFEHPSGKHSYPFAIDIPVSLPSSLESKYGSIEYSLKAVIVRSSTTTNHTEKKSINIHDIIDTNTHGASFNVHERDIDRSICCSSSYVDLKVKLFKNCFYPGEKVPLQILVQNNTNKDAKSVKTTLFQVVTYTPSNTVKKEKIKIAVLIGPKIPRGKDVDWNTDELVLPDDIPPTITSPVLINVNYVLEVKVCCNASNSPLVELPIVVGTLPFRSVDGDQSSEI